MIRKLNLQGINNKMLNLNYDTKFAANKPGLIRNDVEVTDKSGAEAVRTLAFCGNVKFDGEQTRKGINLNELSACEETADITGFKDNKYVFNKTEKGFEITQGNNVIFSAEYNDPADLPNLTYKAASFAPEITVSDESLGDSVIQMFKGSEIRGKNFKLTMPGKASNYLAKKQYPEISFGGRTLITTLNNEPKTKTGVDDYFNSGLAQKTTKGDYAEFMKDQDPTIAIPAGGFGTRFENMTVKYNETKPSGYLPTSRNYRIMATALNMGAMAGLTGGEGDTLVYASQAEGEGSLEAGENVKKVKQYTTDGGAIFEALDKEYIPRDKDLVILNADIITNADVTRAYKALKTLPDAALVIPYYPVDSERAKDFGLMCLNKDENGNMQINRFVEKLPYITEEPPKEGFTTTKELQSYKELKEAHDDINARAKLDDGRYYGNPGIYVMSKEAAEVLRQLGIEDPKKTGLGGSVMKEIVAMCQRGELKNDKGEPMKAYTVPLERKSNTADGEIEIGKGTPAYWNDIGTAEAFLTSIKDIAMETKTIGTGQANFYYGIPKFVLEDFANNFDPASGVLYMSDKAKENAAAFAEKYDAKIKGNVFIAD